MTYAEIKQTVEKILLAKQGRLGIRMGNAEFMGWVSSFLAMYADPSMTQKLQHALKEELDRT